MRLVKELAVIALATCYSYVSAQNTTDPTAIEDVFVETYYISDGSELNQDGEPVLPAGSITYRIYLDLKLGYNLLAIIGNSTNPLKIETTTSFYNHPDLGAITGDLIHPMLINSPGVALDSWLTIGAASFKHIGVPLEKDRDGSVLSLTGLDSRDGLFETEIPRIFGYNIDLAPFDAKGSQHTSFYADNSAIAVLGGVEDQMNGNIILLGQITTDGQLTFELNLLIGTPTCGDAIKYVAGEPHKKNEFHYRKLKYPR